MPYDSAGKKSRMGFAEVLFVPRRYLVISMDRSGRTENAVSVLSAMVRTIGPGRIECLVEQASLQRQVHTTPLMAIDTSISNLVHKCYECARVECVSIGHF